MSTISAPPLSECRRLTPLTGMWQACFTSSDNFDLLVRKKKEGITTVEQELPFLQAVPHENACLLIKEFELADPEERETWLTVGAAMFQVKVAINGHILPEIHIGGYSPGRWNISPWIRKGTNEVLLYVLGEQSVFQEENILAPVSVSSYALKGKPLDKWKAQTGMEQPPARLGVWQTPEIEQLPPLRISRIHLQPELARERICLTVDLSQAGLNPDINMTWQIMLADNEIPLLQGNIPLPEKAKTATVNLDAETLPLWSPDKPVLLNFVLKLHARNRLLDEYRTRFGYRDFKIKDGKFLLNGQAVQLRGESNLLQNRGYQFTNAHALESPKFWDKQACIIYFQTLKRELDCNAIRVHAGQGHPAIFEAADEVGLLVESQSSIWSRGYGGYLKNFPAFLENAETEIREWILRDRHHPSVVMWGVENEMCRIAPDIETARKFRVLGDMISKWDNTRPLCYDGCSGAHGEDTTLYHLHHEETYRPFLAEWKRDKPLVFGEFWIGSRGAEQRLECGAEYESSQDYCTRQARNWKRRIEPMRFAGASGIFPYNFSAQWILNWPGFISAYRENDAGTPPEGIVCTPKGSEPGALPEVHRKRAAAWRHLLGRYCVGFTHIRRDLQMDASSGKYSVHISARNDHTETVNGELILQGAGRRLSYTQPVKIAPCSTFTLEMNFSLPGDLGIEGVELSVSLWEDGNKLDQSTETFYPLPHKIPPPAPTHGSTVYVYASEETTAYANLFRKWNLPIEKVENIKVIPSGSWLLIPGGKLSNQPGIIREAKAGGWHLLIVEVQSPIPGIEILSFPEPLPATWKFKPILGRDLTLSELLLPHEATWNTQSHVLKHGLQNVRWESAETGQPVADAVMLFPGVPLQDVPKSIQGVGAGMDVTAIDADTGYSSEKDLTPQRPSYFRSLMSASRPEYSVLAEAAWEGPACLISTLNLTKEISTNEPRALLLLGNMVDFFSSPATACTLPGSTESGFNSVHVHTDCIHHPDRLPPGLELVDPPLRNQVIAVLAKGPFAATQSHETLTGIHPNKLIQPKPEIQIYGGWKLLEVPSSFEILGPLFPWEFQSTSPREVGYLGLGSVRDGCLHITLCENPKNRTEVSHYSLLLKNLDSWSKQGMKVTFD